MKKEISTSLKNYKELSILFLILLFLWAFVSPETLAKIIFGRETQLNSLGLVAFIFTNFIIFSILTLPLPVLLRFFIFKKPLNKGLAIILSGIVWSINLLLFLIFWSDIGRFLATITALVSYGIYRFSLIEKETNEVEQGFIS